MEFSWCSYQAPPGVEVLRGDLTDAGFLTRAIQGAGGVGDSEAMVPLAFRLFIKATSIRHAYAELARMEAGLLASGLEVCICRPTGLTDGPLTGKAVLATGFTGRATISRADVAHWMLDQLERPAFDQRTPMITVTGAAG